MGAPVVGPSAGGILSFEVPAAPVSSQATRARKDDLTAAVRNATSLFDFLLSGDVAVDIAWYVSEQQRYETDASADVDNILKPLFDAMSGPQGVMINDCQVQHLSSHWHGGLDVPEHLEVEIRFDPDEWLPKQSIQFVIIKDNLCMPVDGSMDPKFLNRLLDVFDLQFEMRDSALARGASHITANKFMSIQRVFHRSRVCDFNVSTNEEFRGRIKLPLDTSGGRA